jgi:hypothetical protein
MRFVGQEMPVGIFLALLAAKNGAKFVAVFTDSDHHSHPASACFDDFNEHETEPTSFMVEGAKFLLCNNRNWVRPFHTEDLSQAMDYEEFYKDEDAAKKVTIRAKDWRSLFDCLVFDKLVLE